MAPPSFSLIGQSKVSGGARFLSPSAANPTDILYAIDRLYARSGLDGASVGPLYRGADP